VVAALRQPAHYLVTPEPGVDDAAWLADLAQALESGGIGRVQLRAPNLQVQPRWRQLVTVAVALCRKAGAEVLINSDIGLARELGVGVHLRAAQLPGLSARPLPVNVAVAASCHDVDELRMAEALDCDFAVAGSVLATASHAGGEVLGWEGFARLRESVSLTIYAIGGLAPAHLDHARRHGAQGIAAIRGLWPPPP
jgi:8-oxo-dGTP diphosphatase